LRRRLIRAEPGPHISTSAPSSTTRFGGIRKNSVSRVAMRARPEYRRSRDRAIPGRGLRFDVARSKSRAEQRIAATVKVVAIHEVGLDGFWIHRLLGANGIIGRPPTATDGCARVWHAALSDRARVAFRFAIGAGGRGSRRNLPTLAGGPGEWATARTRGSAREPSSSTDRNEVVHAHALHDEKPARAVGLAVHVMRGLRRHRASLARQETIDVARCACLDHHRPLKTNEAVADLCVVMPWHALADRKGQHLQCKRATAPITRSPATSWSPRAPISKLFSRH
jgi:hypothetical protein